MNMNMKKKDNIRVDLLAAADILYRRHGFKETTLRMIAAEAGIDLGNMYYYFKTKEEMLLKLQNVHLNIMRSFDTLTNYIKGTLQDTINKGFVGITLPEEQFKLQFFKELEIKFNVPNSVLIKLYGIFTIAQNIKDLTNKELFILESLDSELGIDFQHIKVNKFNENLNKVL